ncbi:MAG: helix-turn-helix transcriptional regulator [Streptosporangiales bacterium]
MAWSADLAALSSLDDPVRERLYTIVCERGEPVGRDGAAEALGIDRSLAAYHLDRLVQAGLLTASYRRPPGRGGPGAGRPAKVYSRSDQEFAVTVPPREYELAARLLAAATATSDDGRARLDGIARGYGTQLGQQRRAGQTSRARSRQSVEALLHDLGYEPAGDQHGGLILRNCPFHELARQHPAVACGMNLALIEGAVTGMAATGLRATLDPAPGQRCCVTIEAAR